MKLRKWLIRILKIAAWFVFSLVLLLVLIIFIIRIPAVQRKLTQRAVNFLQHTIGTPVTLNSIELSFPKKIVLGGLYVQDQSKDTLLSANEIIIDTDLWELLHHRIQLDNVHLQGITSSVYRSDRDSVFNFTYILHAFTSDASNNTDTVSQTPWKFSIHNIETRSLHFRYRDRLEGNDLNLTLGKLDIDINTFDLEKAIITIDGITLHDARAQVVQSKAPQDNQEESAPFLYDTGLRKLDLQNVTVRYTQQALGQVAYLDLGKALVQSKKIDLKNKELEFRKILLENTFISYQQMKVAGRKDSVKTVSSERDATSFKFPLTPWNISIEEFSFNNNNIQYDDLNQPFKERGIDPSHWWISNFTTEMEKISINNREVKANVRDFSFLERNGLTMRSLKADFRLTDNSIELNKFIFDSGRSMIKLTGAAKFASLATLVKTYPKAKINLNVDQSHLDVRDVLYFKPDLLDSLPLEVENFKTFDINTSLIGTIDNLTIEQLVVTALTKTSFTANGTIQGLPDFDHAKMNINLDKFYTTRMDVHTVVDSLRIKSFQIPEWISLTGKLQGAIQRPSIQSALTSDIGSVEISTAMDLDSTTLHQQYRGEILIKEFNLGKLLRQEEMGAISMKATIAGSGFTLQELNASLDLDVADFQFHHYNYSHFKLNGRVRKYFFSGTAFLNDKNLDFHIHGKADYTGKIPSYKLTFDLENADFKALHLSERPLRTRGTLDVDLTTQDLKVINGTVALHDVAVYNGQALYKVDSFLVASIDQDGQTNINITSDIANGSFSGTLNLFNLPDALERYVNNYFSLKDGSLEQKTKPENFKFDLYLKKTELLTDIIFPQLKSFEPGPIKGEFNNLENKLKIHIAIGKIRYADYVLDSILLNVNSTKQSITTELLIDNFVYDSIRLRVMKFDGKISHDSIRTSFVILDSLNKEKYKIGGLFRSLEKVFQFHFLKDEVILNYSTWNTPSDNYLRFGSHGITTHNMSISNNNERILVERNSDSTKTLLIRFQTLELATLSAMLSGKRAIVEGRLDGDLTIPVIPESLFNASLKISDLTVLKQAWGNANFSVRNLTGDKLHLMLNIGGENTDIKVEGFYTNSSSNITATISRIDLKILEPLIAKNIRGMSGTVAGNMSIQGDLKKPTVRGNMTFKDAHFLSTYVNSTFRLKNETVTFNEKGIIFNNFQITDDGSNVATIKGAIHTTNYKDFDLDLNISAKNFQVLNTGARDNTLYYGKVKVNSRATITGTFSQPVVEMNVGFSDDTQFTYIIPQSDKGVLDQKGIVVFVDKDEKKDPFLSSIHLADTVQSVLKGFSLTANIELSNKEVFNIIVDPITGDKLSVQGTSTLTFEMDPNGNMNLSGRYEILKGAYSLSFHKLAKRTFAIEKGGTITWYGDPLNAMLDIRAIYTVETSPLELMSSQSQGVLSEQYKQRVPFYVYMNIKGELMTPNISFLLDMPQDKRNMFSGSVYAKLQDINTRDIDLNKQVFALLVLKRFMADNPFENQASGDLATSARTSVSRILSDQLNRLSQNVKGVQLNFDVKSYEDYTSGQAAGQTQLQLGVSKKLLNDRLVVKLSGNVDVEGENNTQSSFTDYIGDLALEYKITADGRLRVTGFRNSDYDMIDGELTKTGAGLIYIKDYNAFKELFNVNKEQK